MKEELKLCSTNVPGARAPLFLAYPPITVLVSPLIFDWFYVEPLQRSGARTNSTAKNNTDITSLVLQVGPYRVTEI